MRVVVVGATGNVGLALARALEREERVTSVVGIARRAPDPDPGFPKVAFTQADITRDDLMPLFRGADAVVHLAWLIQPSRDLAQLRRVNVDGSARVFAAAAETRVPALVYASSVGAYSPGPKDRQVGEDWPTEGISTSFYSRHKAQVERMLDRFQRDHPGTRVVRLRPGLIFQRDAAAEIRRYFAGPLLAGWLLRPRLIPLVPDVERLRFQAVHADDVADAYVRAAVGDAAGAFNIAADPVLDPAVLSDLFEARRLRVGDGALRRLADVSWRLRLQPTPPGWVDLALGVPLLDSGRARRELGWEPARSSTDALAELLAGLREGAGAPTPPLAPGAGGPLRLRELATGVGGR